MHIEIYNTRAYLNHPVLGERLRKCTEAVLNLEGKTTEEIFGYPDNLKFRSSMKLFAEVADQGDVFQKVLHGDPATRELLGGG